MQSIYYKFLGAVSILCLLVVSSCKKDDKIGDFNFGKSEITMTVNGEPWKASMAVMWTVPPGLDEEEDDNEDHYVVWMYGTEMEVEKGEDVEDASGLSIIFAIPKAKFKNPGGAYGFINSEMDMEPTRGFAYATYASSVGEYKGNYATIGSGGSLKVDKFKTGKASFLGLPIGDYEGYTNLTGTFSMDLTEINPENETAPKVIKITNGKFNVDDSFGFSFLGQYPKVKEKLQLK